MSRHRIANRLAVGSVILTSFLFGICNTAHSATIEQIDKALASGKAYLYGSMNAAGTWEGLDPAMSNGHKQRDGATCMMVYALLSTGESEKDPRLAKAIQFVLKADLNATYPLAFQALALGKLNSSPEVQAKLIKVCKRLVSGIDRPDTLGLYGYNIPMENTHFGKTYYDHSNSQYGLLGVWACADAGIEIPSKYWSTVDKAWRGSVNSDGGWGYSPDDHPDSSVNMTSAGIATLFITDDELSFMRGADCKGNVTDPQIENAMKWIIPKMPHAFPGEYGLYQWYGIERIAIASGYKYFGDFDWFKEGANQLIGAQAADGSWNDSGKAPSTSYGILFLYRGKAPIVMNKLKYDRDGAATPPIEGNWNQRDRDAAGAAQYIGMQLESFMNWQVVNLTVDPDDLHDAPILYLAGFDKLKFSPEQEAKLKKFIEDGGMLLGNADCGSKDFSDSFKALCKKLFDGKYDFARLPDTSPIYTHEQFTANKWRAKPLLESMSNGVRELAVLIPTTDPAKAWHTRQFKSKAESFELMADLYLYSVDRQNIAEKGVTYIVKPDAEATTAEVKVARVQYPGNWDPEPGAWRRLSAVLHNTKKIGVTIDVVKLGLGNLAGHKLVHITGTTAFEMDTAQRDELKKFVTDGGTLVIDAAGGSTEFADAAEKELGKIFGDDAAQLKTPLPLPSPLFGDMTAADVKFRSIVRSGKVDLKGNQISGIKVGGRVAVFFSREDLTAGLVGESVDGVYGYTPDTATRLMAAIVQDSITPPAK